MQLKKTEILLDANHARSRYGPRGWFNAISRSGAHVCINLCIAHI